jgi:hypothetical protein
MEGQRTFLWRVGWCVILWVSSGCVQNRVCFEEGPAAACDPSRVELEWLGSVVNRWDTVNIAPADDAVYILLSARSLWIWIKETGEMRPAELTEECLFMAIATCGARSCAALACIDDDLPEDPWRHYLAMLQPTGGFEPVATFPSSYLTDLYLNFVCEPHVCLMRLRDGVNRDGDWYVGDLLEGTVTGFAPPLGASGASKEPAMATVGGSWWFGDRTPDQARLVSVSVDTFATEASFVVLEEPDARIDQGPVAIADGLLFETFSPSAGHALRWAHVDDPASSVGWADAYISLNSLKADGARAFGLGRSGDIDPMHFRGVMEITADGPQPVVSANDWNLTMNGGLGMDERYVYATFSEPCSRPEAQCAEGHRFHFARFAYAE